MSTRFVEYTPADDSYNTTGSSEDNVLNAVNIETIRRVTDETDGTFKGTELTMTSGAVIRTKNDKETFLSPNENQLNA